MIIPNEDNEFNQSSQPKFFASNLYKCREDISSCFYLFDKNKAREKGAEMIDEYLNGLEPENYKLDIQLTKEEKLDQARKEEKIRDNAWNIILSVLKKEIAPWARVIEFQEWSTKWEQLFNKKALFALWLDHRLPKNMEISSIVDNIDEFYWKRIFLEKFLTGKDSHAMLLPGFYDEMVFNEILWLNKYALYRLDGCYDALEISPTDCRIEVAHNVYCSIRLKKETQ